MMVIVTQADIEAAEYIWKEYGPFKLGTLQIISQAFAAHRIAAIEEFAKVAESDLFAHEECDVAESIADEIRALKG